MASSADRGGRRDDRPLAGPLRLRAPFRRGRAGGRRRPPATRSLSCPRRAARGGTPPAPGPRLEAAVASLAAPNRVTRRDTSSSEGAISARSRPARSTRSWSARATRSLWTTAKLTVCLPHRGARRERPRRPRSIARQNVGAEGVNAYNLRVRQPGGDKSDPRCVGGAARPLTSDERICKATLEAPASSGSRRQTRCPASVFPSRRRPVRYG